MERKVTVVHTTVVTCDDIDSRLKALVPGVEVMNIVNDSLLNDVKREGMLAKEVTRRLLTYAPKAQDWGAELILNTCSSVGEGVDVIGPLLKIPYLKINESMAHSTVEEGEKITVYDTMKITLEPSVRFTSHIAEAEREKVVVDSYLTPDAFEALTVEKGQEKHSRILEAPIRDTGEQYDVPVLTQASMGILIPCLVDITKPVLSSVNSGVEIVAKALKGL